ncbi:uncharacterized protein LOC133794105 [Humulus lupulus]|uniref:uncharacterized protein LOC133794105 n=1 Tax=Humulus lupulus TaxID=3486 RepID=UPI002B408838|nr:uncharacterized protein LOC133794105 [Humulus lupulus]XP_062087284.1 uncharacterized protein LOC133794105 [Humulus lupulus]
MAEVRGSNTWRDEFASFIEDTGVRYAADPILLSTPSFDTETIPTEFVSSSDEPRNDKSEEAPAESLKEQVKGFAIAWGEILLDLGRGCRDIVQQSFLTEDSYIVRKLEKPIAKASDRLSYFNEFLPEDRDPAHAWPVIFFVFILALAAMNLNNHHGSLAPPMKKVRIHPPNASRIQLPDGRHMAYHEQGVPADIARFTIITPHSFLSSRLAGIPGIKMPLLEEFGIRLVMFDLPGFGESDPHPNRNLNSSALDMLHLANAVGVEDKFWVLAHSSGGMHAWAALKYIPDKVAGAALLAPIMNPYEPGMTREEMKRTWENWMPRRKFMYFLARRFPRFLSSFYHRTFLSGKLERIDKWLSVSLGKKDEVLIEEPVFEELWDRNMEESIRQGNVKPFIEEAVLQVSDWGFKLSELRVQRRCQGRGILPWLKSMYSQAECELTGFLGQIHIWQGMDDHVAPSSMADYIARVLPEAIVHKLPNEGHFSYYFFCDECHRKILSTLFGPPQGPIFNNKELEQTPLEENEQEKP